ncbi:MAG: hypothetical protein QOJ53_2059, partial [Sphingomonadales bacterium]|nr:hypothetical protein [Sphingomonadales bacterium]
EGAAGEPAAVPDGPAPGLGNAQARSAAAAALRSGLAAFAGDAATQARLREAARELGVPG